MPLEEDIQQIDAEIAALQEMRAGLIRYQEWKESRLSLLSSAPKTVSHDPNVPVRSRRRQRDQEDADESKHGGKTEIVTAALRTITEEVFNLDDVAEAVAALGHEMHRQDISFVLSRFKKRLGKLKAAEDAGYPEGMFGPGYLVKVPGWDIQP